MRTTVDPNRCQGHALCAMDSPKVFHLGEVDGHATALDGSIPAELEAAVRRAALGCPERAITVDE